MQVSELYHWIEEDRTHGLILSLKDSEVAELKEGKEAIQTFISKYGVYTNDQIEVIYDLIDKISEVAK